MKNSKNPLMKKMLIPIMLLVIVIISLFIYFFYHNSNKKINFGNNLSNKTNQEIEEYILNISSYEADIEVNVESNKNRTKYKIQQNYVSPNIEKQIIQEPSNIQGLQTIYDGTKLTIRNTKLNLNTVYENYPYVTNHYLWLNSFIEDYKSNANHRIYEENNQIVMEVALQTENPYISYKKLFIDKSKSKIDKLIVQDKNKKNLVYILYNEIKINSLKKEEVLAFKLKETYTKQY